MMVTRSSGEATIGIEEVVVFKENILVVGKTLRSQIWRIGQSISGKEG